jgi:NAD(P)-dependent dehydrogenase (short-subunit alcohol dehydrogenase family)
MHSLSPGFRAVVIGASGAIGAAMVRELQSDPRCGEVFALGRGSAPRVDFDDESTIAQAAACLRKSGPLHLLVVATGKLHGPEQWPEKRLSQLNYEHMMDNFTVNTFGPAMVLAHFLPLLARHERSVVGALSAKVGSIEDNRLGGWYSYRASKAALNMLIKTASIELARSHPQAVLAALHPGTVNSPLSAPFGAAQRKRPAAQAAAELLQILDRLSSKQTGGFWAYDGQRLPW